MSFTRWHRSRGRLALAAFALVFGAATIVSGGRVIFGPDAARVAAGRYVPFVVWFNFLAGFAYVGAAVGIAFRARWAGTLAAAIALATLVAFLAFGVHVAAGGAFESRTVAAMAFRLAAWSGIAVAVHRGREAAKGAR